MLAVNFIQPQAREELLWSAHKMLAQFNDGRLSPTLPNENWRQNLSEESRFQILEGEVLEHDPMALDKRLATESGPAGEGGGRDRDDRGPRGPRRDRGRGAEA